MSTPVFRNETILYPRYIHHAADDTVLNVSTMTLLDDVSLLQLKEELQFSMEKQRVCISADDITNRTCVRVAYSQSEGITVTRTSTRLL